MIGLHDVVSCVLGKRIRCGVFVPVYQPQDPPHEGNHGRHVRHKGVVPGIYLCTGRPIPGEPGPILLLQGCKSTVIEDAFIVPADGHVLVIYSDLW